MRADTKKPPLPGGQVAHNGAGGRAFAAIWDLRPMDCRAAGRASRSARCVIHHWRTTRREWPGTQRRAARSGARSMPPIGDDADAWAPVPGQAGRAAPAWKPSRTRCVMYLPARAIGRSTDPAKAAPSVLSTTAPTGAAMSSAAERIPREARPGVRTVVVSGTPLRVAIRPSTGTGPPLLLANGIGTSLEVFQPFVDALDPAIEVIRFDVPGVGGSPLPARPYRFATLARLLGGLLDELGYQAADILGFSWGGELAQQFALCSPRRCRRLDLVATGTGPQTMVPGNPLALAKMLTQRQYLDAAPASCTEEAREPTRKQFPGSELSHRCRHRLRPSCC